MSDLRQVFHDAAAPPTRPLDVEELVRAARRRRHRWAAWLASLGAVVAIATPVGLQWAAGGGSHSHLRTLPAPGSTTTTTIGGGPMVTTPMAVAGFSPPSQAGPKASGEAGSAVTTASSSPAGAEPHAASNPSASSAGDCFIDTTGMAPGQTKSCRFVATDSGGWWGGYAVSASRPIAGDWFNTRPVTVVKVTRAGLTSSYETTESSQPTPMDPSGNGCGDDVIQPGDQVEVDVTAPDHGTVSQATGPYEGGAGRDWNCNSHP